MGMFAYVIKISSRIIPFSYPFVEICLQDCSPLCAESIYPWHLLLQFKKNWCFSTNTRRTKMEKRKAKDRYKTLRIITREFL